LGKRAVHWHWWVILVITAATIPLGILGFSKYYATRGMSASWWHFVYVTFQLFTLESGSVPGPVPWELNAARFLAPLMSAWAIVRTLILIFGARLQLLRVRRFNDHIVICGLGRKGLTLAQDFRSHGLRVVVVERDDHNDNIDACRASGVPVVIRDATDLQSLKSVRAERAEHVIAITGDDGTNVEIAVLVYQLLQGRGRRRHGIVKCWVQVIDLRLAKLLEQHHMLTDAADRFEAHVFNPYEGGARIALREYPLDYQWISADDDRAVRLVVIGFGQMGEALTMQAARVGHFANGKQIKISVIDRDATHRGRLFRERHSSFNEICSLEFIEGEADDPKMLSLIETLAEANDELPTIAICFDDDSGGLSCALDILARIQDHQTPLLVRMSDSVGLATLLEGEGEHSQWTRRVHPFGIVRRVCNRDEFFHERLDVIARALHNTYVAHGLANRRSAGKRSMQLWNRLDEDLKESNRHLADHIPIKLRAIRCFSSADEEECEEVRTFEPAEIELMAKMEHSRWRAERVLLGWKFGEESMENRTTEDITDWEKLSEEERSKDREMVRVIPEVLEKVGERVYRSQPCTRE
jgi:voltage-gated potassium channel Kch